MWFSILLPLLVVSVQATQQIMATSPKMKSWHVSVYPRDANNEETIPDDLTIFAHDFTAPAEFIHNLMDYSSRNRHRDLSLPDVLKSCVLKNKVHAHNSTHEVMVVRAEAVIRPLMLRNGDLLATTSVSLYPLNDPSPRFITLRDEYFLIPQLESLFTVPYFRDLAKLIECPHTSSKLSVEASSNQTEELLHDKIFWLGVVTFAVIVYQLLTISRCSCNDSENTDQDPEK
ncbi:hypothetical protein CANCADRAFT_87032 [Tortispora caseinolytica NRRL Y-17796]|uniref:Protein BIG1 n=1 Tax=Tortispora caseinolytica NRRL Y-17796 TaxID=767744 RepID=A0A1E4TL26_9ASCO|nr:hypothetical protein CANCADRAFT_87032 [Tortispora caseinolytica NRRL Y-17796]